MLLDGASFSIYLDDGNNTFEPGSDALVSGPDAATDGELSYHGLQNGNYWVVEVVVPKGFTGTGPLLVPVDSAGGDCTFDLHGLLGCDEVAQGGGFTTVIVDNTPETPQGTGGVGGATGTPHVTTPPTDTLTGSAQPTSESWRLMLIVMAAVLSSILVLTPSRRRRRN